MFIKLFAEVSSPIEAVKLFQEATNYKFVFPEKITLDRLAAAFAQYLGTAVEELVYTMNALKVKTVYFTLIAHGHENQPFSLHEATFSVEMPIDELLVFVNSFHADSLHWDCENTFGEPLPAQKVIAWLTDLVALPGPTEY